MKSFNPNKFLIVIDIHPDGSKAVSTGFRQSGGYRIKKQIRDFVRVYTSPPDIPGHLMEIMTLKEAIKQKVNMRDYINLINGDLRTDNGIMKRIVSGEVIRCKGSGQSLKLADTISDINYLTRLTNTFNQLNINQP